MGPRPIVENPGHIGKGHENNIPEISQQVIPQAASSDESENEEISNGGYELLPAGPDGVLPTVNNEDSDVEEEEVNFVPPVPTSVLKEFEQARSETENVHLKDSDFPVPHIPRSDSVPLDQDKIDTIKSCMSGFSLPPTQQPKWVGQIPEEEWKTHLLDKLKKNP